MVDFSLLNVSLHNWLGDDLIGWKDVTKGYAPHSLVDDVQRITDNAQLLNPVFSIVQQWNPTQLD